MTAFMGGAITMGCLAIAAFFIRYRRKTGDPFFTFFAASFLLMAAERAILALSSHSPLLRPGIYLCRITASLLILLAIYIKNRKES